MRVAVYLRDPDGNGLELSCDRPRDEWPMANGKPVLSPPGKFDPAELLDDPS